jgi:Tol biopolymer transport system component
VTGAATRLSDAVFGFPSNGDVWSVDLSDDGRDVVFTSSASSSPSTVDANGTRQDVFVRDLLGRTSIVSLTASGAVATTPSSVGAMSDDGNAVAFLDNTAGGAGAEVQVRDLNTGTLARATVGSTGVPFDDACFEPVLRRDGLVVFFSSSATVLGGDASTDWDVFVREYEPIVGTVYCTAETNSKGCAPAIAFTGTPSASAGSGFTVGATNVR